MSHVLCGRQTLAAWGRFREALDDRAAGPEGLRIMQLRRQHLGGHADFGYQLGLRQFHGRVHIASVDRWMPPHLAEGRRARRSVGEPCAHIGTPARPQKCDGPLLVLQERLAPRLRQIPAAGSLHERRHLFERRAAVPKKKVRQDHLAVADLRQSVGHGTCTRTLHSPHVIHVVQHNARIGAIPIHIHSVDFHLLHLVLCLDIHARHCPLRLVILGTLQRWQGTRRAASCGAHRGFRTCCSGPMAQTDEVLSAQQTGSSRV
mmetsp:Transcript_7458/g.12638  ORF Transcript_7458/g.12638 Transcript_7458/m.12638 type:complete len:261 (-) Transcript_7458:14-796(-)